MAEVPVDDGRCFACGPQNPIGLHLHFERVADGVHAQTVLSPQFQGWQGIAHGGIAIALLDEGMAHAAAAAGHRGVTGSMSVRFRAPVPLERTLDIFGTVKGIRRNVLSLQARVFAGDTLLLEGEGNFVSKGRIDAVDDHRSARA